MKSRMITLLLALALGGVAATMVYMYVQRVEEESTEGLKTRTVLVATRSLPAGTAAIDVLASGAFEPQKVPVRYVAPGAFSGADQLNNEGLTLANDVGAGEQLTSLRFRTTQTDAFLSQFPEGTEALSIPLDFVRGVSGHIKPGDKINAFVTGDRTKFDFKVTVAPGSNGSTANISVGGKGQSTFLLLPKIPVMEVLTTTSTGQAVESPTMTLAVSTKAAATLISAQETAKLWFTLVPEGDDL